MSINDISNLQDLDNEKFWRLLHNKARGKNKKKEKMSLKIDGEFTSDSQQLADLSANYFETLVTPFQDNRIYDQFHKNDIENQINDINQNSEDNTARVVNIPLTIQDIHEIIRSLPNGKASEFDGITYEHLKYGRETMVCVLLKFYNCIIDREEVPD